MTWRGRNIYLVGLPGAGKSAIARDVAERLSQFGYSFVDLDCEIESASALSISEIFERFGEEHFRTLETEALHRVSRHAFREPRIVATGGGAVLSARNRAIMRGSGIVVWIDVNVKDAAQYAEGDLARGIHRPLFSQAGSDVVEVMRELYDARRPYYEQATLTFVHRPQGKQSAYTPEELGAELVNALNEMSFHVGLKPPFETLIAHSALGDYSIEVGNGIAATELAAWAKAEAAHHLVVVSDDVVEALHLSEFVAAVSKASGTRSIKIDSIVIPTGEANKTLEILTHVLHRFHELGVRRRDAAIVALGGGVVTDLAGLAANLYQRGVPLVNIPTTLLAQVDAAIGGKTAIDAFGAKNSIGTFYPPSLVLVDPLYLRTLPARQLHAGLAEMLKYGLIRDRAFWDRTTGALRRLVRGLDPEYPAFISQAIDQKLKIVERDEFERASGIRELLNFGHTFGHALEAATGFSVFLHGEAVLHGMRTAAWLSTRLGYLSEAECNVIDGVLSQVPVRAASDVSVDDLLDHLRNDKKRAEKNRFVLLRSIGEAFVDNVDDAAVHAALEYLSTLARNENTGN